jgi:hypothetical protein
MARKVVVVEEEEEEEEEGEKEGSWQEHRAERCTMALLIKRTESDFPLC